jgi:hypothetical protein
MSLNRIELALETSTWECSECGWRSDRLPRMQFSYPPRHDCTKTQSAYDTEE